MGIRVHSPHPRDSIACQLAIFLLLILHAVVWRMIDAQGVIDNEVLEKPEIQCSDRGISFRVSTKNPFRGNVYVRGQFGIPECRKEFYENDVQIVGIDVYVGDCGMTKIRQLQPMGMNYVLVIMVNFHPRFVTKVDRAYNVRCFYAQAEPTLATDLQVGEVPSTNLEKDAVLLPSCGYTLRRETANGPIATTVQIGETIVHQWECNNPGYGMLVKNCEVNDGGSQKVPVIDSAGCPIETQVVQGVPTYDEALTRAFVPVLAYGFPDRTLVHFRCQIQVCSKQDGECVGLTPPNCPMPQTDYNPSSYVNPNVNPTQVIGTYQQPLSPLLPYPTLNPGTGSVSMPPGYPTATSPLIRPYPPIAKRQKPMEERVNSSSSHLQKNRHFDDSPRNAASFFSPLILPKSSATGDRHLSPEALRIARMRRADDETLDVVADSVQILTGSGIELNGPQGNRRNARIIERPLNFQYPSRPYCVNKTGLIALVAVMLFMTAICLALSAYTVYDIVLKRKRARLGFISSRHSSQTGSNSSGPLSRLFEWVKNKRQLASPKNAPAQHLNYDRNSHFHSSPFANSTASLCRVRSMNEA